jgi:hypothetical protein
MENVLQFQQIHAHRSADVKYVFGQFVWRVKLGTSTTRVCRRVFS